MNRPTHLDRPCKAALCALLALSLSACATSLGADADGAGSSPSVGNGTGPSPSVGARLLPAGAHAGPQADLEWLPVGAFSASMPGGPLPMAWKDWVIAPHKRRTRYELVEQDGRTVLHALADRSASGLSARLDVDPLVYPVIEFSWRVRNLIPGADVSDRHAEDAPVRLILAFDGDSSALPLSDRMMFERAKLLTGREMPYATLMYVWENRQPLESVIPNPNTGRIRKIVVASGAERVGAWREFRRDVVEDYRRAFGGDPGRLVAVGVMTDTDNTGEQAEAFYGDIRLQRR